MRVRKEKSFDGIFISGKETVMAEGYSNYPLLSFAVQIILIVAMLYSVIFGFATGLNLAINRQLLWGAIVFFGVVCWGLWTYFKVGIVVFLPILLTYLYAGYRLWKEIENGFWHIENSFIILMNRYYGTQTYTFIVDDYEPAKVITVFLIFVILPLALILSLIILNKASHLLYYPVTLPFIVLPFVVGKIPSTSSFAIYIAVTFGIFVLGNHFKITGARTKEERKALKEQKRQLEGSHYRINIKGSFLMFCGVLLLFMVISVFFTNTTYEKKMNIPKVREDISIKVGKINVDDIANYFDFLNNGKIVIFKYNTAYGGLNEGELGSVGKLSYDNKTDIIINAPDTSQTIYLKGFAGSTYNGNAWGGLSKEAIADYENYNALWKSINLEAGEQTGGILKNLEKIVGNNAILGFHSDNMVVKNVGANSKYTYTPYYSYLNDGMTSENIDFTNPEYLKSSAAHMTYSFSYYSYIDKASILNRDFNTELATYQQKDYLEMEKQYRAFIQKYYTQVPNTGLEQLKADMSGKYEEMKEKYGEEKALGALTAYIRTYIQKSTVYSLTPGALPNGKDFVEYFLYEKKQGFCTHFASAATLAYRFAGIPARYVEGYIAKPVSIKNGKITGGETIFVPDGNGGLKQQGISIREVRISDAGAHAWVEVYKDAFGWVPVEMTPGFQTEENDTLAGQDQVTPTPTLASQLTPTPTVPQENNAKDKSNTPASGNTADKNPISFKEVVGFLLAVMLITLVFILTAGIMAKIYRYIIYKKAEGRKKTIFLYKKIKYLLKASGISLKEEDLSGSAILIEDNLQQMKEKDFLQFMDIVLKAKFGHTTMTAQELQWANNYYRFAKKEIGRNVPVIKKIIYGLYFA